MKPKLYLETTIPSYLTAWPSRDIVRAGEQQITREWWNKKRKHYQLFVSTFVIDEISQGDKQAASERLAAVKDIQILTTTNDVESLAEQLMISGRIPAKAAQDALHIAICTPTELMGGL